MSADIVDKVRVRTDSSIVKGTVILSKHGKALITPFDILYPIGFGKYHVKTSASTGTKDLLAQLAGKHDTIGIDAIAAVVNDILECGAEPLAITNIVNINKPDLKVLSEIEIGLSKGSEEADCPILGGEISSMPEVMNSLYHINCDCVGEVNYDQIITGTKIKPGNAVIGLRSSGLHIDAMSTVRKILFKEWGGAYDSFEILDGIPAELIQEVLKPTKIYVKPFHEVLKWYDIFGAVNITGDVYLKFKSLTKFGLGFELDYFRPQPIFNVIQKTVNADMKDMFTTFNMGWGFALIVHDSDTESIMERLSRFDIDSDVIGRATNSGKVLIKHEGKKVIL